MAFSDFDTLGERAQVIPPIAAPVLPKPLACGGRELAERGRRDGHLAGTFELGLRPFGIGLRLIAECPQGDDALLQRRVVQIGDT